VKTKSEKQKNRSPQEDAKSVPWSRLYEEARGRYEETSRPRRDRVLWTSVLLFATAILVVSVWGLFNRVTQLRRQSDISRRIELTSIPLTQTLQAAMANESTQTAQALLFAAGNEETDLQATATPDTEAQAATMTAEAGLAVVADTEIVASCDNELGYLFEIISGPVLSPRPGYIFIVGSQEPIVQASWIIKNVSNCAFNGILFLNATTEQKIVPLILVNGEKIDITKPEQAINPGDEVEVVLGFPSSEALSIDNEWIVVLNGFDMYDQPHLILKVQDWIIIVEATATQTPGIKPTSPPKPTNTPVRPTNTPPARGTTPPRP
jgi:hypothetical protein